MATRPVSARGARPPVTPRVEVVVKVGGSLAEGEALVDLAAGALARDGLRAGALVVPGGGPFADAVRDADRRLGLSPDAAHWMAVLAMDQYGLLLADRLARAGGAPRTVRGLQEARAALEAARVPVLLPAGWLETTDPLPHSWDVTGDSIAACVASACGAARLVLVKRAGPPPGAGLEDLARAGYLDRHFPRAVPASVAVWLADASVDGAVESALAGRARPGAGRVAP